jgi:predicted nucleic acid-binding protein
MALTYLFDASAAVEIYSARSPKVEKAVRFIIDQKKIHRQAVLYIPNFCVVEVFNTLARKHFKDGTLDDAHYEDCLRRFRDDVHWGRTLYSYDLNRYHVLGADEIIPIEHHVTPESEHDHLSTFDILIIAMACELAYVGRPEDTLLVTCDKRIQKVVEQFKGTELKEREEWKIPGPMDDRSIRRWIPPNVAYLPALKPGDLKSVQGQKPLNL